MISNLDDLYYAIRNRVFVVIQEKNIDLDLLAFDLRIDRDTLINNFSKRIEDFSFYLQTLSLVENWED